MYSTLSAYYKVTNNILLEQRINMNNYEVDAGTVNLIDNDTGEIESRQVLYRKQRNINIVKGAQKIYIRRLSDLTPMVLKSLDSLSKVLNKSSSNRIKWTDLRKELRFLYKDSSIKKIRKEMTDSNLIVRDENDRTMVYVNPFILLRKTDGYSQAQEQIKWLKYNER